MSGKEIKIGKKTIGEDTKVTLSLSTVLWIIGGIFFLASTLFTLGYFDIKSDVKAYKEQAEKDKIEYFNKVDSKFKEEVEKWRDENVSIVKDIGDIKGNVKVILDRTSGNRTETPVVTTGTPPPLRDRTR